MDRAITPDEAAVVRWLLDHAPRGDVTAFRLQPVEQLRVVGGCGCGCSSLDFQPNGDGAIIIADAFAVYSDGKQAGLILWGRQGGVVSLEVYERHPEAADRFPQVPDLRTFEGPGQELL